jgi:hypothetical protein
MGRPRRDAPTNFPLIESLAHNCTCLPASETPGYSVNAFMEITFTKIAGRKYEVLLRRDDGVVLELRSFDRPVRLPHDIAHFVVESELSLKHGLWGLLASGVMLPNLRLVSGRLRPRAAERSRELMKEAGQHPTEAEVLVSFIMGIAAQGIDQDWPRVRSRLNDAWHPRHSQRGPISHDEVRRACQRLREAERKWEELTVGESITVTWPLHRNKAVHRTRNQHHSHP